MSPKVTAKRIGAAAAMLLASTVATAASLERDLDLVLAWIDGDWSNRRQILAAEGNAPPWIRAEIRPIAVAGVEGEHRLFELRAGSDPAVVLQRRLWAFAADPGADAVVMSVFEPAADAGPPDTWTVAGLDFQEGCEVLWRRRGTAFVGSAVPERCPGTSDADGSPVERVYELAADRLAVVERRVADQQPADVPLVLTRATTWTGTAEAAGARRALELDAHGGRAELSLPGGPVGLRLEPGAGLATRLEVVRPAAEGEPTLLGAVTLSSRADAIGLSLPDVTVRLEQSATGSADLDRLAGWLRGAFSSAAQAAADEAYFDIRLRMSPIWPDREDGHWLYVEQAVASSLDAPYRQRVYRLREISPGLYESAVWALPDPDRMVGAWADPEAFAALAPADLEAREGCEILLRRQGDAFVGSTLGSLCPSGLRGARYATSDVRVRSDGLVSWDRGFAADGSQAWGARDGGYVFDRVGGPADPWPEPDPAATGAADDDPTTTE